MDLKFYLNKILKVDNIENYTLKTLISLRDKYEEFLEKTEGIDPDFPMINFESKGKRIKGKNLASNAEEEEKLQKYNNKFGFSKKRKKKKSINLLNL